MSYLRNGTTSGGKQLAMDNLTYDYTPLTNQLKHIGDNVANTNNYTEDIDNQASASNYTYDAIGNLKTDDAEGTTAINWTVYGKIASITKASGTISYTYDASGNRISKTASGKTTVYVRDATGNVMSVYEKSGSTPLRQLEVHLYGSQRLGITRELTVITDSVTLTTGFGKAHESVFTRGEKLFELNNHLGNVLVAVSDKRSAVDDGTYDLSGVKISSVLDAKIDYYNAEVIRRMIMR
jgi:YD repeat-containing protein